MTDELDGPTARDFGRSGDGRDSEVARLRAENKDLRASVLALGGYVVLVFVMTIAGRWT